ncbi:MAG: DnaJ domain-containing protein [Pseudomonadota bacterium]
MFPYLILALVLLIAGVLLVRWFISASPHQVMQVLRWVAIVFLAAFTLFMVFAGKQVWFSLLLFLLVPLLLNARAIRGRMKSARGPSPGQASEVNTRFLRMTLHHDSGAMDGEVLQGRFQGRRLSDLRAEELIELWRDCATQDAQSAAVLEAYMDRTIGPDWREGAGADTAGANPGGGGPMSREEAYRILGLEAGAKPEEVREAHRRLMQRVHPDLGGSNYLATKINEAKALLLGE